MAGRALLYGSLPAALWAAVFGKLPTLRRSPGNPRIRAYWLALLTLALAVTVLRPPWRTSLSNGTEVREFARVVGHSLVLGNLWAVEAVTACSAYPEARARAHVQRRGWALAATVAVMLAASAAGAAHVAPVPVAADGRPGPL